MNNLSLAIPERLSYANYSRSGIIGHRWELILTGIVATATLADALTCQGIRRLASFILFRCPIGPGNILQSISRAAQRARMAIIW